MKYIKKISEMFDSEDLKRYYEVPYLKGELDMKNFKPANNITEVLLNKFPALQHFKHKIEDVGAYKDMDVFYTFRNDGYKVMLLFGKHPKQDIYIASIMAGFKGEGHDTDRTVGIRDEEGLYNFINLFLKTCNELNIISHSDITFPLN